MTLCKPHNAPTVNAKGECADCSSIRITGKTVAERKRESIIKWKSKANGKNKIQKSRNIAGEEIGDIVDAWTDNVQKLQGIKPKVQIARRSKNNKTPEGIHRKVYFSYFGIKEGEDYFCEICGGFATGGIHHIFCRGMGSKKTTKDGRDINDVTNLMALCHIHHEQFGDKKQFMEFLMEVHANFMMSFKSKTV